jgi:hypothetical protein
VEQVNNRKGLFLKVIISCLLLVISFLSFAQQESAGQQKFIAKQKNNITLF